MHEGGVFGGSSCDADGWDGLPFLCRGWFPRRRSVRVGSIPMWDKGTETTAGFESRAVSTW